ncbi:MAG: tetratricopeptide repeat protein [Xanthomonadales bacterium]|nr:tetratricopeptide repeat protein [Xanthomonadales bacterium]
MDDHEQGERVREWLRANGASITTGIAIGLAGILGWQWWQHNQGQHRLDAAAMFQSLEKAADDKDIATFDQLAAELGDEFKNTPYGTMALLRQASEKEGQGDSAAASKALIEAVGAAQSPALAALARLRLARVQLAAGEAQAALDELAKMPAGDFTGLAAEVRGDALLALDRRDEAEAAYQDALTNLETGAPNRTVVEMKLADLGVAASEPGA